MALLVSPFYVQSARADLLKTIGQDLGSPVTTEALTPLLIGAGLATSLYVLRAQISDPLQQNISTRRPLNGIAPFGNWAGQVYPNLIYCSYGVVAGLFGSERGYLRAEEMFFATAYSGGATDILKYVFAEQRPDGSNKQSMPSGHSTTAFAFAGVVGAEHPWYIAVPAYAIATITAYARINDNKHYLHDVVAGGTIGLSYALGVFYKRRERDWKYEAEKASPWPTFSVLPTEGLNGIMLGAAKLF